MTRIRRTVQVRARRLLAATTLFGVAACGTTAPAPNDDLRRDLELARGQGLELAPRAAGQSTVSATELTSRGVTHTPAAAPKVRRTVPATNPPPQSETVVEAPQPTPNPVRPAPSARPAMNPEPRGGYKTMGELIRKAPFPINP
jgi:hypothetical protein